MSYITNVIIVNVPEEKITLINDWIRKEEHGQEFTLLNDKIHDFTGGNKVFTSNILIGAFNYFPISDFEDFMNSLNFEEPVQIFYEEENMYRYSVIDIHSEYDDRVAAWENKKRERNEEVAKLLGLNMKQKIQ